MLSKEELKRYNRQIILSEIGLTGQEKLRAARVLVIGAGGLGCPVLQYLAAAGVGTIGIADDDVVDESNLQRQILYSSADAGRSKAEVAAEKLRILNPYISIKPLNTRIKEDNAENLVSDFDLVLDGSDNFETRYLVNDTCVKLNKPLVFGSIFGFEGQLSVFNYKDGPTYRCVFPEKGEAPNCAINGVLGVLPGIIGSYMANEALKIILQIGETLSGKLMVINLLDNTSNIFRVKRVAQIPLKSTAGLSVLPEKESENNRLPEFPFGKLEELMDDGNLLLVDVREPLEFEADCQGGINIPLSELIDSLEELDPGKQIVFFCNTGTRSKTALRILQQAGFKGEAFWAKAD